MRTSSTKRLGQMALPGLPVVVSILGMLTTGGWQLAPTQVADQSVISNSFVAEIPYSEFRTILVRTNANEQIFGNCGFPLLSEETLESKIDLSKDRRPLMNALSRKSKAVISCCRRLVVDMSASECGQSEVVFIQHSQIDPSHSNIESIANGRMGYLSRYTSGISATPDGKNTRITISIHAKLDAPITTLFHDEAKKRFQAGVKDALERQENAVKSFISMNAESSR